jgi:branched-chain amino acid aminotransferase
MAENKGFGSVFSDRMSAARWAGGVWEAPKLEELAPISLHPGAHALHYGSACFEGLKAHRGVDGVVRVFRLERHVERLRTSAAALMLPVPPADLLEGMILDVVASALADVPEPPGSLYLRPTLIGTEANIGAAGRPTAEALLYVLASPVGDYFAGGDRPLSLAVETENPRTTPQFGMVKTGANYAMALGVTARASAASGVDQVLFAPGGVVQETGASNFLVVDGGTVITPERNSTFLNGVTLDSVLTVAADLGLEVQERTVTVDEVLTRAASAGCEAALSGTAAVLAGVGRLVHEGRDVTVGGGGVGDTTRTLRRALTDIHTGRQPDRHGWLTPVGA